MPRCPQPAKERETRYTRKNNSAPVGAVEFWSAWRKDRKQEANAEKVELGVQRKGGD